MFNLFGSSVPSLEGISALPNLDMGPLGAAGPMTNVSASFTMPQQPDFMGVLSAMGGMGGQEQPAPMMPPPQGQRLQAGGDSFGVPYQFQPLQFQPTAQRLQGLLGGAYGSF